MNELNIAWYKYIAGIKDLAKLLKTNNFVGEYAEELAAKVLEANKCKSSEKSVDLIDNNKVEYQVKARMVKKESNLNVQLSSFRSIQFNFLIVVLFNSDGNVFKASKTNFEMLNEFLPQKKNEYQNSYILTTSKAFFDKSIDLTKEFQEEQNKSLKL